VPQHKKPASKRDRIGNCWENSGRAAFQISNRKFVDMGEQLGALVKCNLLGDVVFARRPSSFCVYVVLARHLQYRAAGRIFNVLLLPIWL